jgi:putative ABC transport system permease protein
MITASLRSFVAHRARLVMTVLAIALGVAFVSGTFTFTATLQHGLDSLFRAANAGTDVIVRHEGGGEGGGNAGVRASVPASLRDLISALPGVAAADGVIVDQAQLTTPDGAPAGAGPGIATTWRADAALDAMFPLRAGSPPQAADEVVIDQTTASSDGYHIGDTVRVIIAGHARPFRVVGIAGFANGNGPGRALTIFSTATAQSLFGKDGRFDEVDVVSGPGLTAAQMRARIAAILPPGTQAISGTDAAAEQSTAVRNDLGQLSDALLAFAGVALFVSGFVIWNTFGILVAGRTTELALLRALGASRRQVFISVLVEAALLGLVASGLGVVLGLALARGLIALIRTFGLDLPGSGVHLPLSGTLLAIGAGLAVTLVAGLAPARRATRVPPVAAMRQAAPAPGMPIARRLVGGLVVGAVGAALLAGGLLTATGASTALTGAGAVVIVLAVTVLAPLTARPVVRAVGAPLRRLPARIGSLATDNAAHNPRRAAATAASLMIGLAAVTVTAVVIGSLKSTGEADIGRASHADLYVTAANSDSVLGAGLAPAVANHDGVALVSEVRRSDATVAGSTHQAVYGVDPATIGQLTDLGIRSGSIDRLATGDVLVSTRAADAHHLTVGGVITMEFGQAGAREVTIGGTFADRGPLGDYLLSLDAFDADTGRPLDNLILVQARPGVAIGDLRAQLNGLLGDYPGAEVLDKAGYQSAAAAMLDQLLNLTIGLLVLAVIIALLGIANTLALSIHERTREIGVLRAVGMRRGQLAATITVEAGIVATYGGLLGLALGVGLGSALSVALGSGVPALPVPQLATFLVVAVLAAMVASALPARRAARMNMLNAIANE